MSVTSVEAGSAATAYGGLLDSVGGIATAVLAIVGLTGFDPVGMAAIATIVFGAALLVQAATILSEYAQAFTSQRVMPGGEGLSAMFLIGAADIVLGVLALLGITSVTLTAVALIASGSALVLSSGSVRQLYLFQSELSELGPPRSIELVTGQMATGSSGVQIFGGLAAIVLGILAVAGHSTTVLTLVGLLLMGVIVLLTGGTLSGMVLSFLRPASTASMTRLR